MAHVLSSTSLDDEDEDENSSLKSAQAGEEKSSFVELNDLLQKPVLDEQEKQKVQELMKKSASDPTSPAGIKASPKMSSVVSKLFARQGSISDIAFFNGAKIEVRVQCLPLLSLALIQSNGLWRQSAGGGFDSDRTAGDRRTLSCKCGDGFND